MPHLYPNLRISQIFGGEQTLRTFLFSSDTRAANTEVGKTLLTTALIRATASKYNAEGSSSDSTPKKRVFYLKPVSTGPDSESDVRYVHLSEGIRKI